MKTMVFLMVLGLAVPAWGQVPRRVLDWEYSRALVPPVHAFRLFVVDGRGGSQQLQVAPSDPGACSSPTATEQTFCAVVACPPAGSMTAYWVQAVSAVQESPPSNVATCWTPPAPACACLDPLQALPGPGVPPPPVPLPLPFPLPPLSREPPPLPQRTAEGLNLQPIGSLPSLSVVPTIPDSAGT